MTFILHRRGLGATLAAAFALLVAPAAFPQIPSGKAVRIIVAGPPGGSLEVVSRLLAEGLQKELGLEAGQPRTSEDLTKSLRSGYERIGAVLKSIDFKPE